MQTQTERDVEGIAAKRAREAAAPEYVCEDITSKYEGEELRQARRSKRSTDERLEHLEDKNDKLLAMLISRSDASVAFGRGLVMKFVVAILAAASLVEGYFLVRGHS